VTRHGYRFVGVGEKWVVMRLNIRLHARADLGASSCRPLFGGTTALSASVMSGESRPKAAFLGINHERKMITEGNESC
jgi:hypothetical protein